MRIRDIAALSAVVGLSVAAGVLLAPYFQTLVIRNAWLTGERN